MILHNIRSVHNVGSIFRTADAAGVKKIYLGGITPAPLDRFGKWRKDFVKVSLGAERAVEWEKANSASRVLEKLKERGFKVFAVEQAKKSMPYYKFKNLKFKKIALILGNETKGLPLSILKKADKVLEIPMRGKKESLNVAVAFGIVVFSLVYSHPVIIN